MGKFKQEKKIDKPQQLPEQDLATWQKTVNLLAKVLDVPAAAVLRVHHEDMEVVVSSESDKNPCQVGDRSNLGTGLYCETVMETRSQLLVSNALHDDAWRQNPHADVGMIAYLGVPLMWPDGEIFGTFCVLDRKPRMFSDHAQEVLQGFRELLETGLAAFYTRYTFSLQAKKVQEKLAHQEAEQHLILDNLPVFVASVDREGRYRNVNRAYLEMFGLTSEEDLCGKHVREILTQEVYDYVQPYLEQVLAGNQVSFELVVPFAIGPRTAQVTYVPDRDAAGTVQGLFAMGVDVHDRVVAQRHLARREAEQRLILDNLPGLVSSLDMDCRYRFANRHSLHMHGFTAEEIRGKHVRETLGEEGWSAARGFIERALKGETLTFQGKFQFRQAGVRFVQVTYVPNIDEEGLVQGLYVMGVDIHDQKLVEEELQVAFEQVRELNQRLVVTRENECQRIAKELHDEFGQMLTSLKFEVVWLNKHMQKGESEEMITQFSSRFKGIVEMLDLAIRSLRSIATSLRPVILDDLGLVAALEWLMQDFRERTGLTCHLNVDPHLFSSEFSATYATAFFRVSQEFLTNVLRHAQASDVHLVLSKRDGWLELELRDNGKGITETEIMQRESLGLHGMRERIMVLGGRFTISGQPGKGTQVRACLPLLFDSLSEENDS